MLGWLSMQLSGHVVVCQGEDGHIAVELAYHGHCDGRALSAEEFGCSSPEVAGTLGPAGCQDTPILPDTPDHDDIGVLRWSFAKAALAGGRAFPLFPPLRQARGHLSLPDRCSPPLHLSHLRTVVLLT